MPYKPNKHHRRSIRLKGYDYSRAGLYFITICTHHRLCLFGNIENGKMILNDAGRMVQKEWLKLPKRFSNIQLHEYVVMPNHFHSILEITVGATLVVAQNDGVVHRDDGVVHRDDGVVHRDDGVVHRDERGQPQGIAPTKPKTIGDMVGAFQSIVTVEYIRGVKQLGWQPFNGKLLQRNYWEHVIRNEQSYQRIAEYIINNPKNWDSDKLK
jgi:putative transposase